MGRFAPTPFYDPVVALTRERLWRALAVMYAAAVALAQSVGEHALRFDEEGQHVLGGL
jgi:hypothetical protein